jgi:hypothetical protein
MKKLFLSLVGILVLTCYGYAQNLAINADGSLPDANAILDVKSNNKGILIPRMSSAARLAIPPTKGLAPRYRLRAPGSLAATLVWIPPLPF